jgi:O-antigen/teichoic acid export membrane protein
LNTPITASLDATAEPGHSVAVPRSAHRRILSGGLIMLVSSILSAGMNFLYNVHVAQKLGPSEFGHVATALTLLLLSTSVMLSFQIVCAKFVARNEQPTAKAGVFHSLMSRAWKVSLLIGMALALFSKPLTHFLHFPTVWIVVLMALAIAFYIPVGVKRGGFQGTCSFPLLATNFTLESAVKLVLALALVWKFGAIGAVIAIAASEIAAYAFPRIHPLLRQPGTDFVSANSREGIQAIVFFVGQAIIMNIDLILVKHYFPSYEAGQYAAVALVGRVLFYASWAVIHAMFPVAAQDGGTQPKRAVLAVPLGLVGAIFLGFLGVLAIAPGMVMKTLFGPGFAQAEPLLALYATGTAAYAIAVVLMAYEMAHKIANTGWLQIVFAGLLITGIALFHHSLHQVIIVLITLMSALLVTVSLPFLRTQARHPQNVAGQEAA